MTREEAETLAKSMPRLEALVRVRNDMDSAPWKGFDILLTDGHKIGVGNPDAIEAAKNAIIGLLDRQLEEERAKSGSIA